MVFHDVDDHFLLEGRPIKSLRQLAKALPSMSDSTFNHHVNEHKNDFYNWVLHVYKDQKLANKIKNTTSPHETLLVIQGRFRELNLMKKNKKATPKKVTKKRPVKKAAKRTVKKAPLKKKSRKKSIKLPTQIQPPATPGAEKLWHEKTLAALIDPDHLISAGSFGAFLVATNFYPVGTFSFTGIVTIVGTLAMTFIALNSKFSKLRA